MLLFLLYFAITLIILCNRLPLLVWEISSLLYLITTTFVTNLYWPVALVLWAGVAVIMAIAHLAHWRAAIAQQIYQRAVHILPKLSKTEEQALNAGDTWFEQAIFRGQLDWDKLAEVSAELSPEEQAFLDNETAELCQLLDDWQIAQDQDLPEEVWTFLKEKGFFGLIIPKQYGGKAFSARAHSDIVMKIGSRSGAAAVTVMVPNSLGPGELLNFYGTDAQKAHFLPRLAQGLDIPCFALTEPEAGSDATSIQTQAIVTEKMLNGKKTLGLVINYLNKRWITLAPIATLIGLAVNLKDPDNLLAGVGEEGITCILISRDTENLKIGNRHLPANQGFMNGSIRGHDIFVPMDAIIGGQSKAGHGWPMLVECLSVGRAISLPALGTCAAAVSYMMSGAFARLRRQFHVEIAQFEGIQEPLARIAGLTYLIDATRQLTLASLKNHKKPSVASAITKYHNTELAREIINHAMDIHAGRAVVNGPRNYLAQYYTSAPITITVEGANIMSRNLLIFGQGSMACHPFIRQEFYAIQHQDKAKFNQLLWQHVDYFLHNFAKTVCSAWTAGLFITVPRSKLSKYYKQLARLSYAFAWVADLALIYLGGALKRQERLSARLADAMSYLYLAMAALRLAKVHHESKAMELHAEWAVTYCFYQAQQALVAFCQNFPSRVLGGLIRLVIFPFGSRFKPPCDKLDTNIAKLMVANNAYREELKKALHWTNDANQPLDRMEMALQALIQHDDLMAKIPKYKHHSFRQLKTKLSEEVHANRLTQTEMTQLLALEELRWQAIQVDEFTSESIKDKKFSAFDLHTERQD